MKRIAVYNLKGGVGKTATAVNLAWLAAAQGQRTLLWDLDPQGAATYFFRIQPRLETSTRKLFGQRADPMDSVKASDFEHLDVLPADFAYRKLERLLVEDERVASGMAGVLDAVASHYDVAILDCAPSLSGVAECIFDLADALLVPTIPTTLSLRTLAQLMKHLKGRERRPLVLPFFCMVDRRKSLHRKTCEWVHEQGLGFLQSWIPYASDVERMGVRRAPLGAYAGRSAAARAYSDLWSEALERIETAAGNIPPVDKRVRKQLMDLARGGLPPATRATAERTGSVDGNAEEIEFKFLLSRAGDLERVRAALDPDAASQRVTQINHFFDTPTGALRARRIGLRLREEAGRMILTAKGAGTTEGELARRPEEEAEVSSEVGQRVLRGELSPWGALAAALPQPCALLDSMRTAIGAEQLAEYGHFENERTRVGPVRLSHEDEEFELVFELDRTSFPGGRVDEEVEVEWGQSSRVSQLRACLLTLLKTAGVEWKPAPSKVLRFQQIVEKAAPLQRPG